MNKLNTFSNNYQAGYHLPQQPNKQENEARQSIQFNHLINSNPNHLFFNYENMKMGNPLLNSSTTSNKVFKNSFIASGYEQDFEDNSFSHTNNHLNHSGKYYNDFSDSTSAKNIPSSPLVHYQFPKTNSFLKRSDLGVGSKKNLPSLDEQCQSEDSKMFNLDNLELQTLNQSDYNGLYDQQDRQPTLNVLPDAFPYNFINTKVNSYNAHNLMSPSITDKNSFKFNFDGSVYSGQGVFSPAKRTSNDAKSSSLFEPQVYNKTSHHQSSKTLYMNNTHADSLRKQSTPHNQNTPSSLYKNKKMSLQLNSIKEKNELSQPRKRTKVSNSKLNTISEKNHTNTHESSSPSNNKIGTFRSFDEEQNNAPIIPNQATINQPSGRKISFGSKQEDSQQIFHPTKTINPKSFNHIKSKRNNLKTKSFNTTNPVFYTPKIKKSPLNLSEDPNLNLNTRNSETEFKKKNLKIRLNQKPVKMAKSMINLSPILNNDCSLSVQNRNNFFEEFDNESLYRKGQQDHSQRNAQQQQREYDERGQNAQSYNAMLAQFNEFKLMQEQKQKMSKAQSQLNSHSQYVFNQNQVDPYSYRKTSDQQQQMENPFLYHNQANTRQPEFYPNYPPHVYQSSPQWPMRAQPGTVQQPPPMHKPPITQEYIEYLQNKQILLEAKLAQQARANSSQMLPPSNMAMHQPQFIPPINQFYQHQQPIQISEMPQEPKSNEKPTQNKRKKNKKHKKKKNNYK
jgi:hypothetical protein